MQEIPTHTENADNLLLGIPRPFGLIAKILLFSGIILISILLLLALVGFLTGAMNPANDGTRWIGSFLCSVGFFGAGIVGLVSSLLSLIILGIGKLFSVIIQRGLSRPVEEERSGRN